MPPRQAQRLHTLADVFAYAAAHGVKLRIDGSEIQVRRPKAHRPGRRAFVSGKKKQNTIKFTKICDGRGRTLRDAVFRPGRMHDQTALQNRRDRRPAANSSPTSRPRWTPATGACTATTPPRSASRRRNQPRTRRRRRPQPGSKPGTPSHRRGSAWSTPSPSSKHWRPLQRWIGRREDLPETVRAIGSLVSDRAAAW